MSNIKLTACCYGEDFQKVIKKWTEHIRSVCQVPLEIISLDDFVFNNPDENITTFTIKTNKENLRYYEGDSYRLSRIIEHIKNGEICFQVDIDTYFKKDFSRLASLPFDFIMSRAFLHPKEIVEVFSYAACTGFFVAKPSSYDFCKEWLDNLISGKNCLETHPWIDQWPINYMLLNSFNKKLYEKREVCLDGHTFEVDEFTYKGCKIAILPNEIISRTGDITDSIYGNHTLKLLELHYG
jgi:hypothetical protein